MQTAADARENGMKHLMTSLAVALILQKICRCVSTQWVSELTFGIVGICNRQMRCPDGDLVDSSAHLMVGQDV
jgi:hypothetical protein